MIIRIKKDGVDTNEWAIVELQGDLESLSNQPLKEQFIGDLHYTKSGTPILIVGHHILYGKETSLDKPIVVLEKKRLTDENDSDESIVDKDSTPIESRTSYVAKAIVREKLVFRARPKPIIANAPEMI